MLFNWITNIEQCFTIIRDTIPVNLIYYSHIPASIAALIIGFFVIKRNKQLIGKIIFSITIVFATWCFIDIFLWTSYSSQIYMFFWPLADVLSVLLFILNVYMVNVFASNRDVKLWTKISWLVLLLPLLLAGGTKYATDYFSIPDCVPIENELHSSYVTFTYGLLLVFFLISVVTKYVKAETARKKQILIISAGSFIFLSIFFLSSFLIDYLINNNIWSVTDSYKIEIFSLFAMPIFLGFLSYLIVKFKAFNIKLIGAQALVWALVLLIGSQFFYLDQMSLSVIIITAITLIISSVLGLILVRSVKKEIVLREKLEIANAGQTNLIHIMNHQIKGYLGTDRNIFAELLTDDYGNMPEASKPLLQRGLEASSSGVEYVTEILKGASAENGTLPYNMKLMDFKAVVSDVAAKQKEIADKKGLKFNFNVAAGNYNIMGDTLQLGEAIRNLINNSISYTPSGSVSVDLAPTGNLIQLIVKDTGVGIKEEDKSKLFKAGGVGRDSIKVNVNSSGYGLVFTKGVILAHKGKIWFESAGEGKGTTFFVDLPVK